MRLCALVTSEGRLSGWVTCSCRKVVRVFLPGAGAAVAWTSVPGTCVGMRSPRCLSGSGGLLDCPQTTSGDRWLWIPRESTFLTCLLPARVKSRRGRAPQRAAPQPPLPSEPGPFYSDPASCGRGRWSQDSVRRGLASMPVSSYLLRGFLTPSSALMEKILRTRLPRCQTPRASLTVHCHQHCTLASF